MGPSAGVPSAGKSAPRRAISTTGLLGRWREKGSAEKAGAPSGKGDSTNAPEALEGVRWSLSSSPGSKQRCALILYGLPKFFRDRSLPTLLHRVVSRIPMPVDVFVHTYDLTHTTNSRNGELACKLDPDEVRAAKPVRVEMQSQDVVDREHTPLFSEMKRHGDAWFNHFVSLRNVLRQYNSIQRVRARRTQGAMRSRRSRWPRRWRWLALLRRRPRRWRRGAPREHGRARPGDPSPSPPFGRVPPSPRGTRLWRRSSRSGVWSTRSSAAREWTCSTSMTS